MRRILPNATTMCATVFGIVLCSSAAAPADDSPIPGAVAAALKQFTDQCDEAGGKASTTAAVQRADLTGDGKEDFILLVDSIQCMGAATVFGDRDKPVQVFAGDGSGGAESVYTGFAYATKLERSGSGAKAWVTLAGKGCGRAPARFFTDETYCDRPLVWNAEAKKLELAPLSAARAVH